MEVALELGMRNKVMRAWIRGGNLPKRLWQVERDYVRSLIPSRRPDLARWHELVANRLTEHLPPEIRRVDSIRLNNMLVDFWFPQTQVVLKIHTPDWDLEARLRQKILEHSGYKVINILSDDLDSDIDAALRPLLAVIRKVKRPYMKHPTRAHANP